MTDNELMNYARLSGVMWDVEYNVLICHDHFWCPITMIWEFDDDPIPPVTTPLALDNSVFAQNKNAKYFRTWVDAGLPLPQKV